jgi:hypothetical protein
VDGFDENISMTDAFAAAAGVEVELDDALAPDVLVPVPVPPLPLLPLSTTLASTTTSLSSIPIVVVRLDDGVEDDVAEDPTAVTDDDVTSLLLVPPVPDAAPVPAPAVPLPRFLLPFPILPPRPRIEILITTMSLSSPSTVKSSRVKERFTMMRTVNSCSSC